MAARIKSRGKWKDVKINPNVFAQDNFASFICMQELTDYNVIDSKGKITRSGSEKKTKPKSQSSQETTELPKNKKKRKKKKSQDSSKLIQETTTSNSNEEIPESSNKKKKKKRKNKKKNVMNDNQLTQDTKESSKSTEHTQLSLNNNNNKRNNNKRKLVSDGEVSEVNSLSGTPAKKRKKEKKKKKAKVLPSSTESVESTVTAEKDENENKHKTQNSPRDPRKKPKWDKSHLVDDQKRYKAIGNSPDMTAWQDLFVPDLVLRSLAEQGFTSPTPIQTLALTAAIRDRLDIVGAAETGSGKTLAFGIPLINRILQLKEQRAEEAASQKAESDDDEFKLANQEAGSNYDEFELSSEESGSDYDEFELSNHEAGSDDDDRASDLSTESDDDSDKQLEIVDMSDMEHSDTSEDDWPEDTEETDMTEETQQSESDNDPEEVVMDPEFEMVPLKPQFNTHRNPLYALILTPTRELAIQVHDHLVAVAKYTRIKVVAIVGGMAQPKQIRLLKRCPEIVVATPGRLWDLLQEGEPHLGKVHDISCLVIDEADRMVEKGHFQELSQLLQIINSDEERKKKRQTFVFSATLTFVHSGPQRLKFDKKSSKITEKQKLEMLTTQIGVKPKPKVIDLTRSVGTAEGLTEARINTTIDEKDIYLFYFLRQFMGRTLVFANSKDCIRRLVSIFKLLQCCPLSLHADMHQRQRLKNLDRFKGNPNGLLLATDVAARGLDIPDVQHVIHYQVPRTTENYIHRSGRTARAYKQGLSVMFVGPEDLQNYRKIIKSLNRDEDLPLFPVDQDTFFAVKARVNLARSIDKDEHRLNKKRRENQWYEKAAKEMDIELDDDQLLTDLGNQQEQSQAKKKMEAQRYQLKALLQAPLKRCYFGKYPTKSGKLQQIPTFEHGGAISVVKAEHKRDQKLLSQHPIMQSQKQDKMREKKFLKLKKKKRKGKN